MPAISVIVPVYKAEAYLSVCTDSILGQSFDNLELLLIDDGSPDGSGALCDAIAAADLRVRVFHKENGGVSSARNFGMQKARGRYIAFADADDWWEPNGLELLYGALTKAGADSAGCAHYNVLPDGCRWPEPGALPPGVYGPEEIRKGLVSNLLGNRLSSGALNGYIWRFLFSRDIILDHSIAFHGAYLEDELFLMEYFCLAGRLVMLETPLYCYLQNPASVTRNYLPDYMDTFQTFMADKEALAVRFSLDVPQWRESSSWAGLLIAIGNEYAPGNPAPWREKQKKVKAFTRLPEMENAIKTLLPRGLGRNKQIVANLVRRRMFGLLTLLYVIKNRR